MVYILHHDTQKNAGELAISKISPKTIQVLTHCHYIFRWMHTHLLSGRIKSISPGYGVVAPADQEVTYPSTSTSTPVNQV
jgi:hypothetical protein